MTRLVHWERKLADFHKAAFGRPFVWGQTDCCLTASDGVLAITGIDPGARFRGAYSDMAGGYRAMKDYAGGGVSETIAALMAENNWPEIPVLMARRGDVGLVPSGLPGMQADAAAICLGPHWATRGEGGLVNLPLKQGRRAWRV
ncbi:DUF6950 family protein [Thalassospira lohafexi]|uniref:DUF6950 domain-containing protein n=1 Tax=Thalassospira lohafexi TaxID=744227 RepID=A0A2N3L3U4_9PROT|nr:hypothetical protein [Thalassospira lohafexi]PKR57509.1 hypothetical protein COO92_16340 [Thalassospira lohafexi]